MIISLIINIQLIITNSKDYCLIIYNLITKIQLIITNTKDYCLIIYNLTIIIQLIITNSNDYNFDSVIFEIKFAPVSVNITHLIEFKLHVNL